MKRIVVLGLAAGLAVFGAILGLGFVRLAPDIGVWLMIACFVATAGLVVVAVVGDRSAAPPTHPSRPTYPLFPTPPTEPTPVPHMSLPHPIVDAAELHSLIDDDQMQEITTLVEAASAAIKLDSSHATPGGLVPDSKTVEPIARLEVRLADYNDADLRRVVKESESVIISEMVRSGQLTGSGSLTEADVASMIFLAYTSDEMLAELRLRKAMDDRVIPQPGAVAVTGNDFAPLKNIE